MDISELVARESIRQTMADYTAGTDGFSLTNMAACFAKDGVLEFTGGDPLVGPAAIVEGLRNRVVGGGGVTATYVRHHVSSVRFCSILTHEARVTSYFAVFTDVGIDHWGRYGDTLVPVSGKWFFAVRRIDVDGFSEQSLMRPVAPE